MLSRSFEVELSVEMETWRNYVRRLVKTPHVISTWHGPWTVFNFNGKPCKNARRLFTNMPPKHTKNTFNRIKYYPYIIVSDICHTIIRSRSKIPNKLMKYQTNERSLFCLQSKFKMSKAGGATSSMWGTRHEILWFFPLNIMISYIFILDKYCESVSVNYCMHVFIVLIPQYDCWVGEIDEVVPHNKTVARWTFRHSRQLASPWQAGLVPSGSS